MVDRGLGHATVDVTGVKKGIQCPFYWAFLVKCKLFKDYMYEEVKIIYWKWWIGTWEMQLLTSLVWNLGCSGMGQGRHWPRDNVRQHSQVPPPTCCWKQACQLGGPNHRQHCFSLIWSYFLKWIFWTDFGYTFLRDEIFKIEIEIAIDVVTVSVK